MPEKNQATSPLKIVAATLAALVVATLALLGAVMPAEYGMDPLGTGKALGLLALSQPRPMTLQSDEYRLDSAELVLHPSEWAEYTYRLEAGATLLFSWRATGTVSSNLHSAPDGAPAGYAESFDNRQSDRAHGSYQAPFPGTHGWYWENTGTEAVTIHLDTAGFYSSAHEGRHRISGYHALTDLRGNEVPTSPTP